MTTGGTRPSAKVVLGKIIHRSLDYKLMFIASTVSPVLRFGFSGRTLLGRARCERACALDCQEVRNSVVLEGRSGCTHGVRRLTNLKQGRL